MRHARAGLTILMAAAGGGSLRRFMESPEGRDDSFELVMALVFIGLAIWLIGGLMRAPYKIGGVQKPRREQQSPLAERKRSTPIGVGFHRLGLVLLTLCWLGGAVTASITLFHQKPYNMSDAFVALMGFIAFGAVCYGAVWTLGWVIRGFTEETTS